MVRGVLRRLVGRVVPVDRGRMVVAARTPAGWGITVRGRQGRFDSFLTSPKGDDPLSCYWQADLDEAIESVLSYLAIRDPFQAQVLRGMVRERRS